MRLLLALGGLSFAAGLHYPVAVSPALPSKAQLSALSGDSLLLEFEEPLFEGASAVQSYQVEWDTDPGVREVQTITTATFLGANEVQTVATSALSISEVQYLRSTALSIPEVQTVTTAALPGSELGGSFSLVLDSSAFGGSAFVTGEISHNADASDIKTALEALSSVQGSCNVTRGTSDAEGGFTWSITFAARLGNVPQLTLYESALTPVTGSPSVEIGTVTEGNELSGAFQLSFHGHTTVLIPHDASGSAMERALEALPSIATIAVSRSVQADNQGGFTWSVTFTHPENAGNVQALVPVLNNTRSGEVLLQGKGARISVESQDGNELSGGFQLGYGGAHTTILPHTASAGEFKDALESMLTVPVGTVAVERSAKPSPEGGFEWTVSFLQDYNRTFEGDIPLLASISHLNGSGAAVQVTETRKGTAKTVQTIGVSMVGSATAATVPTNATFGLYFGSQRVGEILAMPRNSTGTWNCDRTQHEVQTLTISTRDRTASGRDETVSTTLLFALTWNGRTTGQIKANLGGSQNCANSEKIIESELQALGNTFSVHVTSQKLEENSHGCTWGVTFTSSSGVLDQMQVAGFNEGEQAGPSNVVVVGDDTLQVCKPGTGCTPGENDLIKAELEKLDDVGIVTVDAMAPSAAGECGWRVTFDTKAGTVPMLRVEADSPFFEVNVCPSTDSARVPALQQKQQCVNGTSEPLGGNFAVYFRGQRSRYLPHDTSARELQVALQSLPAVGDVDVHRSTPDENGGFVWAITFLTAFGDLPDMRVDGLRLTGTVATAHVAEVVPGLAPPFDSLDWRTGLPLGSTTVTSLDDTSVVISGLDQGIPYFFRVAATNAHGRGPFRGSDPPFALPLPQLASGPTAVNLSAVDGSTLRVDMHAPLLSGGTPVSGYLVEYSTRAFATEVQAVRLTSSMQTAVQTVVTSTHDIDEVQLVHIKMSDIYVPHTTVPEVQEVDCDASGGTFSLSFQGQRTTEIQHNAKADDIKAALEALSSVQQVHVALAGTHACSELTSVPTFNVTFFKVEGFEGDVPLITVQTNNLKGSRRAAVRTAQEGAAPLEGSFSLSFRGDTTVKLSVAASPAEVQAALENLDTVQTGGVRVVNITKFLGSGYGSDNYRSKEVLWAVTFIGNGVGGDVEALAVPSEANGVTGNGATVLVYTDGTESFADRRGCSVRSTQGNELGGSFQLSLGGYLTAPIDFNAAGSAVKAQIEALPNVGTIDVARSAPSPNGEYTWTVTFLTNPGYSPFESHSVNWLTPANTESLSGAASNVTATSVRAGSDALRGEFRLSFTGALGIVHTTDVLDVGTSALELKASLEELDTVGEVEVSRELHVDGITWLVTFDACRLIDTTNVCNWGNLPLMNAHGNFSGGNATAHLSIFEVRAGSGPDKCSWNHISDMGSVPAGLPSGLCFEYLASLTGGSPFTQYLQGLATGRPYFVRVSAHTAMGFGRTSLPAPEFVAPSNNKPGQLPPVRLLYSTRQSITVEWDYPTTTGGSPIAGFELWMDAWAGGTPRRVYDGTGQPDRTQITVNATLSLPVEAGRQYRFRARAINHCSLADALLGCFGDFSEDAVFTVRAPRSPSPPPKPIIGAASRPGVIEVFWSPPVDNGGAPITTYQLYYAHTGASKFTLWGGGTNVDVLAASDSYDYLVAGTHSTNITLQARVTGLTTGESYKFYVVAANAKGSSGRSATTTALAATSPGRDTALRHTFAALAPRVTDVDETSISVAWRPPPANSSGGSPVSGYRLYMFPGTPPISAADTQPVKTEVQVVSTHAAPPTAAVHLIHLTNAAGAFQVHLHLAKYCRGHHATSEGLYLNEHQDVTTSLLSAEATTALQLESALVSALRRAGCSDLDSVSVLHTRANVTVDALGTPLHSRAWNVSFAGGKNSPAAMTITTSELTPVNDEYLVEASVRLMEAGTQGLRGTFTLSFRGSETPPLPYDVSARGMKAALENLDTIQVVSVSRNATAGTGHSWSITFDSEPGDVEALIPTSGRLVGVSASVFVATLQPGSRAVLVYDGVGFADAKSFAATGLFPGETYAFKVAAINAVGQGILSAASQPVAARTGSSPAQTTASGSALVTGMSGTIREQQVIKVETSCLKCDNQVKVFFPVSGSFTEDVLHASAEAMEQALGAPHMGIGAVSVTHVASTTNESAAYSWTVTFLDQLGDVPLLGVNVTGGSSVVAEVREYLQGRANEFVIEPKQASGWPIKDMAGFVSDVFYTELWTANSSEWVLDGFEATYNPARFDTQRLTIPRSNDKNAWFQLTMDTSDRSEGQRQNTSFLGPGCSPYDLKLALEELENVRAVDVSVDDSGVELSAFRHFTIIFTHDLGQMPMLEVSGSLGGANVTKIVDGITEIQTITTSSDADFIFEEQAVATNATGGDFSLRLGELGDWTRALAWDATAEELEDALEQTSGIVDVEVSLEAPMHAAGGRVYTVRFIDPVGDLPLLSVDASRLIVGLEEMPSSPPTRASNVSFPTPQPTVPTRRHLLVGSPSSSPSPLPSPLPSALPSALPSTLPSSAPSTSSAIPHYPTALSAASLSPVRIDEVTKGWSPLAGSFAIAYEGEFTNNVPFDASASAMKRALESLSTLEEVAVQKENRGAGHRWTITFTKAQGNLRNLTPMGHAFEHQTIRTTGGSPTPLGGFFTLSFGGATTRALESDAHAEDVKLALEELPALGRVDVERTAQGQGQYAWRVTFRSEVGDLPLIHAQRQGLTGTDAAVGVEKTRVGEAVSLTGVHACVEASEKVGGLPSFTGMYAPKAAGNFALAVRQLQKGGLYGEYFDNQWLLGSPAVERIDPAINFDWGTGALTAYGRDYVSVRWSGKLQTATTEEYTLYLQSDDGARLFVNHDLVIDGWAAAGELMARVNFTAGIFNDFRLEYREEIGRAAIALRWSSFSLKKAVVPPASFYHAAHIVGSPFPVTILPGAADFPYSTASGAGLSRVEAGSEARFTIAARDAQGNVKVGTPADEDAFTVDLVGPADISAVVKYVGGGQYAARYTALKAGDYRVHVKTGGMDIYCGQGEDDKCSPFQVTVDPGSAVAEACEAESISVASSSSSMDYIVEAAAGDTARFYIQAKDAYGNNKHAGGDPFKVLFTNLEHSDVAYRADIHDFANGSYAVTYSIPMAGSYKLHANLGTEGILLCTNGGTIASGYEATLFQRGFAGLDTYRAPAHCSLNAPPIVVVHGQLHPESSTAFDMQTTILSGGNLVTIAGLSLGIAGVPNQFSIAARDYFGNLRHGDGTTNFPEGYGDGSSDAFMISLSGPQGYTVLSTSVVHVITIKIENTPSSASSGPFFKIQFAGKKTLSMPFDISASAMDTVLEMTHMDPHMVDVSRTESHGGNSSSARGGTLTYKWSITFLSHLHDLYPNLSSAGVSAAFTEAPPSSLGATINAAKSAGGGLYPVEYTAWYAGSYDLSITSIDGDHIFGSPLSVDIQEGPAHAPSSTLSGDGLLGGVAGDPFMVTIQARDARLPERQTLRAAALVVKPVQEVQEVVVASAPFSLHFRSFAVQLSNFSSSNDLTHSLEQLPTLGVGSVKVSPFSNLDYLPARFRITFTGLQGNVPTLSTSTEKNTVVEVMRGDTPTRKEVQVFHCAIVNASASAQGFWTLSLPGHIAEKTIRANASVADLQMLLGASVNVSMYASPLANRLGASEQICDSNARKVFITFEEDKGDLPLFVVGTEHLGSNAVVTQYVDANDGAVDGVHPVWGSFKIGYGGETTRPIPAHATAEEVEDAIEAIVNVGDVIVWKDAVVDSGVPLPIWTIEFSGLCTLNATDSNHGPSCPYRTGDLPLLSVDSSGLGFEASFYRNQRLPEIVAREVRSGTLGNPCSDATDLEQISVTVSRIGTDQTAQIAMHEVHSISCAVHNNTEMANASFVLSFFDSELWVGANTSILDLEYNLARLHPILAEGVTVRAGGSSSGTVCEKSRSSDALEITFHHPGTLPPLLMQPGSMFGVDVSITERTQGVDSVRYTGSGQSGRYEVTYTTSLAGNYTTHATIAGVGVGTHRGLSPLSADIQVFPAKVSAPHVSHAAGPVITVGESEQFTLQAMDRFGNPIFASLEARHAFFVRVDGSAHPLSGQPSDAASNLHGAITELMPNTNGVYNVAYTSELAGPHELQAVLRSPGGLLATYFTHADFTGALLGNNDHLMFPYHDPPWCPPSLRECDSTRLDPVVNFTWGLGSPLVGDPSFPVDYFSARWVGEILSPVTGAVSFFVEADNHIRLSIDNKLLVDQGRGSKTERAPVQVDMRAGEFYPIQVEYVGNQGEATIRLSWESSTFPKSVVSSDALYYSRHTSNSPYKVASYPGKVDALLSSATGSGLAGCTAMNECQFTIQARDSRGNHLFNRGSDEWVASLVGVSDWAGIGRTNDKTNGTAIEYVPQVKPSDWAFLGSATVVQGRSYAYATNSDFTKQLIRGDVLVLGGEVFQVDGAAVPFSNETIPLNAPFLGEGGRVAAYRGSRTTGGQYVMSYKPFVRGVYELSVSVSASPTLLRISTSVLPGGSRLEGSFKLVAAKGEWATPPIAFNASAENMTRALQSAVAPWARLHVERVGCSDPTAACSWLLSFVAHSSVALKADFQHLFGNAASVAVVLEHQGSAPTLISDVPFLAHVSPGPVSAPFTTAYGKGLVKGRAGDTSAFTIQAKDAWGNDQRASLERFKVMAFPVAADSAGKLQPGVAGNVVAADDGAYRVTFEPTTAGKHAVVVAMGVEQERQLLVLTVLPEQRPSGQYALVALGRASSPLSWQSSADDVSRALNALAVLGTVKVHETFQGSYAPEEGMRRSFLVTFASAVGDVPQLAIDTSSVGLPFGGNATVKTVQDGIMEHIKAVQDFSQVEALSPWANQVLANEAQVVQLTGAAAAGCAFQLSFNGHTTRTLAANESASGIQAALEALQTVGSISVDRRSLLKPPTPSGYEWRVEFTPASGHTFEHMSNYGDLPLMVATPSTPSAACSITVLGGGTGFSDTGFNFSDGVSPFEAFVDYAPLSSSHCTAVHEPSVAGLNGLASGIYQHPTSFTVEARDRFRNRVLEGSAAERQVLETSASIGLRGSFAVGHQEQRVTVPHNVLPEDLQRQLEQLPGLGVTAVSSTSVRDLVSGVTLSVVHGSSLATPSSDLRHVYEVGDWIRIGDVDAPVFSISDMISESPYSIALSSPYVGATNTSAQIFEQGSGAIGHRIGYQYIIDFSHGLGDLPALLVDSSGLSDVSGMSVDAQILNCDARGVQTVSSSALENIGGEFHLEFKGERSSSLMWNAGREEVEEAVLGLPSVHAATVVDTQSDGAFGARSWTIRMDSIDGDTALLYAEGYRLTGSGARVAVELDCPRTASYRNVSAAWAVGSDVHTVRGRLGANFVARLSGAQNVKADVSYVDDGRYKVTYLTPRLGTYSLEVVGAQPGGLNANYFNNRWLYGDAVFTRVDASVDFIWAEDDAITPTGRDYVSARWTGHVEAAFSETYTFSVRADDGARLFVGGELLFDAFEERIEDGGAPITYQGKINMAERTLTELTLEWRESTGLACVQLMWSSPSQAHEVIPPARLFSTTDSVVGAPFTVIPKSVKPETPTEVTLEALKWDTILVQWHPPDDDGGESLSEYKVEWWSAVPGAYGQTEVQSIMFASTVDGGVWWLTSPGGSKYPFPLAWDVSEDDLAEALEYLGDVGSVDVEQVQISPPRAASLSAREYRVTFVSNLGNISPLKVDPSSLSTSSHNTAFDAAKSVVVCDDGAPLASAGPHLNCTDGAFFRAGNATLSSGGSWTGGVRRVSDGAPFAYLIENAVQSSSISDGFFVRVSARNPSNGLGSPSEPVQIKPMSVPDPPLLVELARAHSPDELVVTWTETSTPRDKGSPVSAYFVEWNISPDFSNHRLGGQIRKPTNAFPCRRLPHPTFGEHRELTLHVTVGTPFFVRVSAINEAGIGLGAPSVPTSLASGSAPDQFRADGQNGGIVLASIPAGEETTSVRDSSTSLQVTFPSTVNGNGLPVTAYVVEHWRVPGRDEVQVVEVSSATNQSNAIEGTFTLSFNGATTTPIPPDATEIKVEAALEAIPTLRDVSVVRTAATLSGRRGYQWAVTFLTEVPAARGLTLLVDGSGLEVENAEVYATVGHGLRPGLPGWKVSLETSVEAGARLARPSDTSLLLVNDFVRFNDGSVFQIEAIDHSRGILHLDGQYFGPSGSADAHFGATPPGSLALGFTEKRLPSGLPGGYVNHVMTGLVPGHLCYVRVSAVNALGESRPQLSDPPRLTVPKQAPDAPLNVKLAVNSETSLRVSWNHPDSDGGGAVTKYKIEWDSEPGFDSSRGSPLGSHHVLVSDPAVECRVASCAYAIYSLTKGLPYFVRVHAYNLHGYSAAAGLPHGLLSEAPKRAPDPPSVVLLAPGASATSLVLRFPPSADDGGAPVTKYLVEWDALGLAAARTGALPRQLLYAPHAIQTIQTSCDTASLYGTFRVALSGFATGALPYDATAAEMEHALEALPTAGEVVVTRSEKSKSADGAYGYTWDVTFLTLGGHYGRFGGTPVLLVATDETLHASEFAPVADVVAPNSTSRGMYALRCANCKAGRVAASETVPRLKGFASHVVTLYSSSANATLGGSFRLRRSGHSTPALPVDIGAADMAAAVTSLCGGAKVLVTQRDAAPACQAAVCVRSWVLFYVDRLGPQPALSADASGVRCSEAAATFGVQVDATAAGELPLLDSRLRGELVLSGDAIVGDVIQVEIPGLLPGEAYHARVSAWNGAGFAYGPSQYSSPALAYPSTAPGPPSSVVVSAASDQSLRIAWEPPRNAGGSPISKYLVEWDVASGLVREVQVVQTSAAVGGSTAGGFRLAFQGQFTPLLQHDVLPERLGAALEALPTVHGRVAVERFPHNANGFSWRVTFADLVGDQPLLVADAALLRGPLAACVVTEAMRGANATFAGGTVGIQTRPLGAAVVEAPYEVQQIALSAQAEDVGGFFYVEFMGERTRRIDASASASALQSALRGLSTVSDDVVVTKVFSRQSTVAPISNFGWAWAVMFASQAGDLPSMIVSTGGIRASSTAAGGALRGTGTRLEVSELTKGRLPTVFVTPPSLTAGVSYVARVSTYSARGWSDTATSPALATPEVQLPAPPASAAVSVFSSTSLEVSWVGPRATGGPPVLRYQVQWDVDASFDDSAGSAIVSVGDNATEPTTYSYRIQGLSPGVPSVVRVMAANERGYGPAVFAEPVGLGDDVHEVRLGAHADFALNVTSSGRSEVTDEIEAGASAARVQSALQDLETAGTVVVTRQSAGQTAGLVYRVTFVSPITQEARRVQLGVLRLLSPLPSPLPSSAPTPLPSGAPTPLPSGAPTPLPSPTPTPL